METSVVSTLTAEQQAVVNSTARNILCVAGAGAGKSRVLTERILRLIREGVEPSDILAICYTNEAAKVLHDRLHPASGEYAINLGGISTLHSFCLKHLQLYAGYENVTVLDEVEADEELFRCAKSSGVKATEKELKLCRENWLREQHLPKGPVQIATASYYRRMEATRALDFNSILTKALEHLSEKCPMCSPKCFKTKLHNCTWCDEHQRNLKHLFVDECHDSSRADMEIYAAIQTENRCYVLDFDQAIFSFRGGDVSASLELAKSPEWEVLKLEGNFRSTQTICDAAQRLIEHNTDRIPKRMVSLVGMQSGTGEAIKGALKPSNGLESTQADVSTERELPVACEAFESDTAEAVGIATAISVQLALKTAVPSDFSVLARTNAIAENIADTLQAHGIPVRRRVKPNMPEDWRKAKAAVRMLQARNNDSILRFVRLQNKSVADHAEKQEALGKANLAAIFMTGLECTVAGLQRDLQRLKISHASTERIGRTAEKLPEPTLADIVLVVSQDWEWEEQGSGVFAGTVHAAKGCEWENVIVAGCEESVMPSYRSDIQEERRVAYVAMTRAKRRLVFTYATARREQWGRREYAEHEPSRFIKEALP